VSSRTISNRWGSLSFTRHELTGALGDSVTVLPIVVAVGALTELSLARMLLGFGAFQIVWGLWYGLPVSVEPMKALAALAIGGALGAAELAVAGLLAGVASLIPIVGMKLVYVPVTLYLGAVSYLADPSTLWFTAVFVAVSFVVVDTIPDLVLRPFVSGRTLHVGAVMIAYTLGPLLFGWYGIFLGPIILVLLANFSRHVLSILIDREPLVPYAVDPGVATGQETGRSPPGGPAVAADGASQEGAEEQSTPLGGDGSEGDPSAGRNASASPVTDRDDDATRAGGFEFGGQVADRE